MSEAGILALEIIVISLVAIFFIFLISRYIYKKVKVYQLANVRVAINLLKNY